MCLIVWFNLSEIFYISFSLSCRSWRVRKEHHRETDEDPACQWLQCRVSIVTRKENPGVAEHVCINQKFKISVNIYTLYTPSSKGPANMEHCGWLRYGVLL